MKNVNDTRARLFNTGKHKDYTLPPNNDSLKKHVALKSVLELANCKCKKNSQNNLCKCAKINLNCTDFCFCIDCKNHSTLIEEKSIFEIVDFENNSEESELDIAVDLISIIYLFFFRTFVSVVVLFLEIILPLFKYITT